MKKLFKDSQGFTGKITSNMIFVPFKQFEEFTKKQQLDILNTFDYMEVDEIKELLFIDEHTSLNDILTLNSCWTQTDHELEKALYNIVNNDYDYFNIGYIDCSYYREYYAVDNGGDGYIKLHVKYDN